MKQSPRRGTVRHVVAAATLVLLVAGMAAQSAPAVAGARPFRSIARAVVVPALPRGGGERRGSTRCRGPADGRRHGQLGRRARVVESGSPGRARHRLAGPRRRPVPAAGAALRRVRRRRPVGYGAPSSTSTPRRGDHRRLGAHAERHGPLRGPRGLAAAPAEAPRRIRVRAARALRRAAGAGPHAVTRAVYDLGDQAYQPPGLTGKVELAGDVHYPTDLPAGRTRSCCSCTATTARVQRRVGRLPLAVPRRLAADPQLRGLRLHRPAAGQLRVRRRVRQRQRRQRPRQPGRRHRHAPARRAAGEAPRPVAPLGDDRRRARSGRASSGGRLLADRRDGALAGRRGGHLAGDRRPAARHPYGIDAVLPLAPVDFTRATVNRVPLEVMLPYCDGDVSDLQGMHFFDDARYKVIGDPSPKGTVTVMGANHNFFNTVWSPGGGYPGGFDDGSPDAPAGSPRISSAPRGAPDRRLLPPLRGRDDVARPGVDRRGAAVGDRAGEGAHHLPAAGSARSAARGRPLRAAGRADGRPAGRRGQPQRAHGADGARRAIGIPAWPGRSRTTHPPGRAPQGALGWNAGTGNISFDIPAASGDVHGFDVLQFRIAVNPAYSVNTGVARQNLTVELADGSGRVGVGGRVQRPSTTRSSIRRGSRGHFILNQLRFPLGMFTGVDLSTSPRPPGLRPDQQGRRRRVGHGLHQGGRLPPQASASAMNCARNAPAYPVPSG